tara:strand:+ start:56 stop:304 length:249 start_codon:yes stop_codon:yes gene_type:complete
MTTTAQLGEREGRRRGGRRGGRRGISILVGNPSTDQNLHWRGRTTVTTDPVMKKELDDGIGKREEGDLILPLISPLLAWRRW